MSESSTTPPPSDDLPAAFNLGVGLLKERRHLGFDELADVLKSCGYPVAGEHPYIYRQDTCLLAWVGMSDRKIIQGEWARDSDPAELAEPGVIAGLCIWG